MTTAGAGRRGLSAGELAAASAELRTWCRAAALGTTAAPGAATASAGPTVLDAVPLSVIDGQDDLLLVLQEGEGQPKQFVHAALGGARARLTTTTRRFSRDQRVPGPAAEVLRQRLVGARLVAVEHCPGERRATLRFVTEAGATLRLEIELFGARGLWALTDDEGILLAMSRAVETAVRTLRRGDRYAPPPPARTATEEPPGRFAAPVLPAIDAHFTAIDLDDERLAARTTLQLAAERALRKATARRDGLSRQLDDVDRSDDLRRTADLMLAYAHTVRRGATTMCVPDPDGEGKGESDGERTIELDPSRTVVQQATALYDKARRLDDGRAITIERRDAAERIVQRLAAVLEALGRTAATTDGAGAGSTAGDTADHTADEAALLAVQRRELQQLGAIAKEPATARPGRPSPPATPFRRFDSAEGYPIYVGRNNTQNDELTMRFANGNDLWLHVGGGRPGSHVIVRLPKQKSASLETLLDAATLAVHFSKARGEPRIDVVYTQKKHVRKPKGAAPGAVVPAQTRTLTVLHDPARLGRLLGSAAGDDDAS